MNYQSIEDIYTANDKIRENLKQVLSNVSDEQAGVLPEGETWSIANIAEHLSMVDFGMMRICAKLLNGAKDAGLSSNGEINVRSDIQEKFAGAKDIKVDAPETVQPRANQTIAESLAKMDESRRSLNELRTLFESVGCEGFTFPHPAFGDLNSNEWLVLLGGHEARHTAQIQRLLDKMN
jgi:DinB superfamily